VAHWQTAIPLGDHDLEPHLASELEQRERLADHYDIDFGHDRVFPELVAAMLAEVPSDSSVLEVGAATGLLTRPLLEHVGALTALEPSKGLLRRLLNSDIESWDRVRLVQGIVEDLPREVAYDVAVVTFTPRRGVGLARLLTELAVRVSSRMVFLLPEDTSLDWAYLARFASMQGFDVRLHLVNGSSKQAIVLVADIASWHPTLAPVEWASDSREVEAPYPPPRGTAVAIMREFIALGDRIVRVRTAPEGLERLHGNLRTAAHRAGAGVAVHRRGDEILLVRMPASPSGRKRPPAAAGE
jgi:hypothetical protein